MHSIKCVCVSFFRAIAGCYIKLCREINLEAAGLAINAMPNTSSKTIVATTKNPTTANVVIPRSICKFRK